MSKATALALVALAVGGGHALPLTDPCRAMRRSRAYTSSGLPSTFGLTFGNVIGVTLFVTAMGMQALAAKVMALGLIGAGVVARIVLAGHWTSQMFASTMLGLVAALIAKQALDLAIARFSRSQHGSDIKS